MSSALHLAPLANTTASTSSGIMHLQSHPSATFIMPPRLSMQHSKRQSRRGSNSSFGSWSSSSQSSLPKATVGEPPCRSNTGLDPKPKLLGVPVPRASSSEHWRSFHRRFQSRPKRSPRTYSINDSEGMWSCIVNRMLAGCNCNKNNDDWVDDREIPLRPRFWEDEDRDADEEECRVELTE